MTKYFSFWMCVGFVLALSFVLPVSATVSQYNSTVGTETVWLFNGTGSVNVTIPSNGTAWVLIIGGGGGGGHGRAGASHGGGGGAGGVLNGTLTNATGEWNITIGAGGAQQDTNPANGNPGINTTFSSGTAIFTAYGGGYGAGSAEVHTHGGDGGSGGGGQATGDGGLPLQTSQSPLTGYGKYGAVGIAGQGSGGGGATANGTAAAPSGHATGFDSSITGALVANYSLGGSSVQNHAGANYGDGGSGYDNVGTAGANGVVIIRFTETVEEEDIVASFDTNVTSGTLPFTVGFNDTSTNTPTAWNWSVTNVTGNNTPVYWSTDQNTTRAFSEQGNYSVTLTASNDNSTDTSDVTWINISGPTVLTGWNRQDILMNGIFHVNLTVRDIDSNNLISAFTVLDSFGSTFTATAGVVNLSYNYTPVSFTVSSTGYTTVIATLPVIDSDINETIYLSAIGNLTASNVSQQAYPHYVTFHLKEGWGTSLSEVAVTVQGISTSTGNWDWIVTLLGIPLDEVPINSTSMMQTTDSLGTATFYLIPTGKYNISFSKAGYTIPSMILVPQDEDYIIYATGTGSSFYRDGQDELAAVSVNIIRSDVNASYSYLNLTYLDTTGHTTGGSIDVIQKADVPGGTSTTLAHWDIVSSSFTQSIGVVHITQVSGYVSVNATHSDFGTVKRSYPFQLNSVPISFLGFGDEIKLLVALGMMLFTAMLGGAVHGRQVMLVMAIEGVIFYTFHWFDALIARGVPETSIILGLLLMFVVSVLANFEQRKKREKY